ncbi:hypothetical protein OJAV_G00070850 [Oryzias javanicus]|uniref:Uncharacterized protein n=1 Tax=Oryzias javanicus TaxID=123683 RepID=A0A437D7E3_ORYJA|nr:hypothetical protein OJAV_G00070850 [Oryzias javanicus]
MKVSQTLLWVLLLRGSCLLPPETATASVLDTEVNEWWKIEFDDYNYTDSEIFLPESTSEPASTKIFPAEQPEPPGVLFYVRVILGVAIAILFIFPTVCLIFLWHKRVSSSGRSSGEHNL